MSTTAVDKSSPNHDHNAIITGLMKFVQRLNINTSSFVPHHDKTLALYQSEINELYADIQNIYYAFNSQIKAICKATDTWMDFSRAKKQFYSSYHEHPPPNDVAETNASCSANMADEAIKIFWSEHELGHSVLQKMQKWMTRTKSLGIEVERAQFVYNEMYNRNKELETLLQHQQSEQEFVSTHSHQHNELEHKLKEIKDKIHEKSERKLSNKIHELLTDLDGLTDTFQKLKHDIDHKYAKIIKNKYNKMDSIYCDILQSQQTFFAHCHRQMVQSNKEREEPPIEYENMIDIDSTCSSTQVRNGSDDLFDIELNNPSLNSGQQNQKEFHDFIGNSFRNQNQKDTEKEMKVTVLTDLMDMIYTDESKQ